MIPQPIAAKVGVDVLERGGNAVDAAVAVAAAMNVTEPTSTGIGGDCFALFYSVKDNRVRPFASEAGPAARRCRRGSTRCCRGSMTSAKPTPFFAHPCGIHSAECVTITRAQVYAMNGSGRAPAELTIDRVRADCFPGAEELPATAEIPLRHPHTITVPGAAAGWVGTIGEVVTARWRAFLRYWIWTAPLPFSLPLPLPLPLSLFFARRRHRPLGDDAAGGGACPSHPTLRHGRAREPHHGRDVASGRGRAQVLASPRSDARGAGRSRPGGGRDSPEAGPRTHLSCPR